MTLISAFEVPPAADAAFVAAWRGGGGTLHRALREDVLLRFVSVSRSDEVAGVPFTRHSARYELVHEDGDLDGAGGVFRISALAVEPADDERFLTAWHAVRAVLATQRGYLGTRLYVSAAPADFRFIEIARWSSPLMIFRARALHERLPFPAHAGVYERVELGGWDSNPQPNG
jgi:hypothetical protein